MDPIKYNDHLFRVSAVLYMTVIFGFKFNFFLSGLYIRLRFSTLEEYNKIRYFRYS